MYLLVCYAHKINIQNQFQIEGFPPRPPIHTNAIKFHQLIKKIVYTQFTAFRFIFGLFSLIFILKVDLVS